MVKTSVKKWISRFGLKVETKDIDSLLEETSNMVKTKDIDSLVKETSSVTQWRSIR